MKRGGDLVDFFLRIFILISLDANHLPEHELIYSDESKQTSFFSKVKIGTFPSFNGA